MNRFRFLILIFFIFTAAGAVLSAALASHPPLLVSVQEAIEAKRDVPRTVFVDVRGEEEFEKIRIPGSINVPLHFIRTKSYLKNMHVILVNQGYAGSRLLQQVGLLNKKGIEAAVLAGGVAGWSQQGYDLVGSDSGNQRMLHNLAPAVISENELVRYVDISPQKTAGDSPLFSTAEHIPVNSPDDIPTLAAVIDGPEHSPLETVVIFNQKGDYRLVENLPGRCRTALFFLQGGSTAYDSFLLRRRAILEPKSERMKTTGGCSTCPPVNRDSAARK